MPPIRIKAERYCSAADLGVKGTLIDLWPMHDGTACALAADRMPEYRQHKKDQGRAFQGFSPRSLRYTIHHLDRGSPRAIRLSPTRENFTDLRALPGGRWLLVRPRRRNRGTPPGGVILNPDGAESRRFNIGDLAQHIDVTADGAIWVGYGDEAYCTRAPQTWGIACFDARGRTLFGYGDPARSQRRQPECVDCYALNAESMQRAHAYIYPELRPRKGFPLVRLGGPRGSTYVGDIGHTGAKAFAIDGRKLLLIGGYRDFGAHLYDLKSRRKRPVSLRIERNRALVPLVAFGRGPLLFVFDQTSRTLYQCRVP